MILTLCNQEETLHIDITADQFERLRSPGISREEIALIASACHVDTAILAAYVSDINKSAKETVEIDGSCDYNDHL
jgi:hypothetical protein